VNNCKVINLHLPEADGIRGLACLIVLVVHSIALTYPQSYPYLTGCGKIGVWLFFTLSAYLLTHQFLYKGFSKDIIVSYFINRFFRIYPIFFIAAIAYYLFGTANINNERDLFLAITLQGGFGHLWIIPVQHPEVSQADSVVWRYLTGVLCSRF
jgi:peptidoglycan/LPS O-acetylase OafA/YrhL